MDLYCIRRHRPYLSYVNAKGADNYGVEVDIRKNLDFIGMRKF